MSRYVLTQLIKSFHLFFCEGDPLFSLLFVIVLLSYYFFIHKHYERMRPRPIKRVRCDECRRRLRHCCKSKKICPSCCSNGTNRSNRSQRMCPCCCSNQDSWKFYLSRDCFNRRRIGNWKIQFLKFKLHFICVWWVDRFIVYDFSSKEA